MVRFNPFDPNCGPVAVAKLKPNSETSGLQVTVQINCPECGRLVEVASPRLGETPRRVRLEYRSMHSRRYEPVDLRCPHCQEDIGVCFEYR